MYKKERMCTASLIVIQVRRLLQPTAPKLLYIYIHEKLRVRLATSTPSVHGGITFLVIEGERVSQPHYHFDINNSSTLAKKVSEVFLSFFFFFLKMYQFRKSYSKYTTYIKLKILLQNFKKLYLFKNKTKLKNSVSLEKNVLNQKSLRESNLILQI